MIDAKKKFAQAKRDSDTCGSSLFHLWHHNSQPSELERFSPFLFFNSFTVFTDSHKKSQPFNFWIYAFTFSLRNIPKSFFLSTTRTILSNSTYQKSIFP